MSKSLQRIPLGDALNVASGQVDPTVEPYSSMPHIGGENIESNTGRILNVATAKQLGLMSGKYHFCNQDVLYSKIRPNLNKVAVPGFVGICSADIYPLRPKADRLSREFLAHLLRSQDFLSYTEKHSSRTNIPKVNRESLLAYEAVLPPLAEQRRIAEVLDRAEALRAKRRAALAQLDSLTQSIFLDLFGDPVTNPKSWATTRFADICERVTVGIVVRPASYYVSDGVPALRSLNIKPGKIVLQELVYISKTDNETKLIKTRLKTGDLVLVRSGQPGTAAVVPAELDGVNAIDLLIATPLPKQTDATFLCGFFNSAGGRDLVLSRQRGQVQKHLNVGSLNAAIIPFPPIELQQEFARRVAAVERLKATQRASLAELDALFASLQHRAFRGEL